MRRCLGGSAQVGAVPLASVGLRQENRPYAMRFAPFPRAAWQDALRLALQSASAAALGFMLVTWLDRPHASWAVISALLVGQASSDGTLAAVRGRLGGTLLGAAVGLGAVLAMPGDGLVLTRLLLAAAVVSLVAGLWPSLRYAAVVAAIIALEPGIDPVEGAWDRTVAIAIGAASGALCAFVVWPQSARRRALKASRRALDDCAALLDASMRCVMGEQSDVQPLHRRFRLHLGAAREQMAPMNPQRGDRDGLERAVHAIERLWHALIVLDRITSGREHWSPSGDSPLHARLQRVRTGASAHLRRLAACLGDSEVAEDAALQDALAEARDMALAAGRREHVDASALGFALGEIARNLSETRAAARRLAAA